jgi:hypothetical protein
MTKKGRPDDFARVHPRLEDLQGDLAADRRGLLGKVDDGEAAGTELLADHVVADPAAGLQLVERRALPDGRRLERQGRLGFALFVRHEGVAPEDRPSA